MLADVAIPMRDHVVLKADVFIPLDREGPFATILVMTPYGRRRPAMMKFARCLSEGGFAVLLQDARGRFQSGGEFLHREEEDGQDTLAWLTRQSWCNGRVGLLGISLSSFREFLAASSPSSEGPEIRAIVNFMGAVDIHSAFYHGGALVLHWALPWGVMMNPQWTGRIAAWQKLPWQQLFRHLPLARVTERTSGAVDLWRQVIERPVYDESWRKLDLRHRLSNVRVPVLHLSGWYDNALSQVLKTYATLAVPQDGRAPVPQSLILGPWDHQTIFFSLLGGGERTELGALASIELLPLVLDWFGHWFGQEAEEGGTRLSARHPGALLYVMEAQTWLEFDTFPPPAREESWYLTSGGKANTAGGDGALVVTAGATEGADRFTYDPADPVPTVGGALWPFQSQGLQPGPADQREVERRADVLVYTSAPLEEDRLVVGIVRTELWAATSAPDTDFTAKLVDVAPDGTARLVQDGILRCRFATGVGESLVEPGRRYRWRIEIGAIAHCFRAGHRLRLDISSSNFPRFDRNLNTAEPIHTGSTGVACEQTVFHGGATASRLLLPILPTSLLTTHRWEGSR
ncbi:MAG TPA: CocE/NonD family hydrolase [Thermoanaerobaculia bacterium]|jgi:hypothetical protein